MSEQSFYKEIIKGTLIVILFLIGPIIMLIESKIHTTVLFPIGLFLTLGSLFTCGLVAISKNPKK
jgi:hypothetical protein